MLGLKTNLFSKKRLLLTSVLSHPLIKNLMDPTVLKKNKKKKQNAQPSWTPKKPNNIKLQLKPNRQIQKKLNLVDLDCALQSWIKLIKPTLGVSTLPTAQLLNRGGLHACESQMMRWSRSESERMDLKNKVTNYF